LESLERDTVSRYHNGIRFGDGIHGVESRREDPEILRAVSAKRTISIRRSDFLARRSHARLNAGSRTRTRDRRLDARFRRARAYYAPENPKRSSSKCRRSHKAGSIKAAATREPRRSLMFDSGFPSRVPRRADPRKGRSRIRRLGAPSDSSDLSAHPPRPSPSSPLIARIGKCAFLAVMTAAH